MSQKVMLSEQEAPPEPPEKPPMCEVVQVVAIVTQVFAIGLFLYGGYAYNAVFLSRILKAAGRDHLVTPFAIAFNTFYILGLLSYIAGAITDPGSVPKRWLTFVNQYDQYLPVAYPRQEWQPGKATRCKKCNIVRPERAHHCHFCHKCILRMDHHCPWMNNCVGMFNHKYFVLLGIYAGLASLIALVTTMPDMFQCISSVIRMDPTVNYGSVFSRHQGYISAGGHVLDATMTVEEAKLKCASLPNCEGFCFKGTEAEGLPLNVYFKDKWNLWSDGSSDWTAYRYQKESRLEDRFVLQFLLLGFVIVAANGMLVPLNLSHLPNVLENVTMIETYYENMPNPFHQHSSLANMAQIFGSPGIDWFLPMPPLRPLTDGICFARTDEPVGSGGFAVAYEDSQWREPEDVWRSRYHAQPRPKEVTEQGPLSSMVRWFAGP